MSRIFEDDLDAFFEDDDLALVGPEWEETEISAIFSNNYQSVSDGGNTRITSSSPNILVKNEDVKALGIVEGTRVVVEEDAYVVKDVQADSPGLSQVFLHKAKRNRAC